MAKIFISYDHEDSDFAELLDGRLAKAGHDTRMDVDILNAGEDWRDKLDQALKASDVLVVIITPEARASEYVTYEWAFALGAGIRVIPVELRDAGFHPRLKVLQRIDFTNKQRPWEMLLHEVDKAAQSRRITTVSVPDDAPPTIKSAVAALDSLDVAEQVAGVKALVGTDHPAAREALAEALGHPAKSVRMAAALSFPDKTDPRIIPGLIAAAHDHGFQQQWYPGTYDFISWIARMGLSATPHLMEALQHSRADVRGFAANSLGRIGEIRAAHHLIDLLQDEVAQVREQAAQALGRVGDNAALRPLIEALADPDEKVQARAAAALGRIGDPTATADLIEALRGHAFRVRVAAAEALGRIKAASAVPLLLQCLGTDGTDVRKASAVALGRIGDNKALSPLLKVFQDVQEEYMVRRAAASGLGLLGDGAARNALLSYLSDRQRQKKWEPDDLDFDVAQALIILGCTDTFELIGETLNHFKSGTPPVRIVELLGAHGPKAVAVLAALKTHSATLRGAALKTLRTMGTPEALAAAVKLERSR